MKMSQIAQVVDLRNERQQMAYLLNDIMHDHDGSLPTLAISIDGSDYDLSEADTEKLREFAVAAAKRRLEEIESELAAFGVEIDEPQVVA